MSTSPPITKLTPQTLLKDLTYLSTIDLSRLSPLLPASSITTTNSRSTTPPAAESLLTNYQPSKSTAQESQTLIKGYVSQMEEGVLGIDKSGIEVLGSRIDLVRKVGGEIGERLEEVEI